jgi:hypothetical protein
MHWGTFIVDAGLLALELSVIVLLSIGPTSRHMDTPSLRGAASMRDADLLMTLDLDDQRAQQLLQEWH